MASAMSLADLIRKVRSFCLTDPNDRKLDDLIKIALVSADREIRNIDKAGPLAWDVVPYDEYRTKYPADISAISQASPGIITAASISDDVTGHGFASGDIVLIDGIAGMEELNQRRFIVTRVDATTLSLKRLNSAIAVNTTGYTEWTAGGRLYHAGQVLSASTILLGVSALWGVKMVIPPMTFDGFPSTPIGEPEVMADRKWLDVSRYGRPTRWEFRQQQANRVVDANVLLWYPVADQPYNLDLRYQKEVNDLSGWTENDFPLHPPEVHEALWHGALAMLVGSHERAKRSTKERMYVRIEVMFEEQWLRQWEKDKLKILQLSRKMSGQQGGIRGISG